jgi:integrase
VSWNRRGTAKLKLYVKTRKSSGLLFHSKRRGKPLLETHVLHDGLHPALKALGLPNGGVQAFRHGCNRSWELSSLNPTVLRQQIGHSSATTTARYRGQIAMFFGPKCVFQTARFEVGKRRNGKYGK